MAVMRWSRRVEVQYIQATGVVTNLEVSLPFVTSEKAEFPKLFGAKIFFESTFCQVL